jgi:hypothetical protein
MSYASGTSVSVEKTEGEIKAVLRRYGATAMASFEGPHYAVIAFEMKDRRITMRLPLPDKEADEFRRTPSKRQVRSADQQLAAWEQACRARWRALFLCIKAKLESVESGIETFEDAFLAHIQMPDGRTVSDHVRQRIALAYEGGDMQPLLPKP